MTSTGMIERADDFGAQVYHLRLAGFSFERIVRSIEPKPKYVEVRKAYSKFVEKLGRHQVIDDRRALLDMELARLDELQASVWDKAIDGGSLDHAKVLLEVMKHRAKIAHLEQATPDRVTVNNVLVSGSQQQFIEALRSARALPGRYVDNSYQEETE